MALIKCPECGKEVSDKAVTCPNCGFKIAGTENLHEMSKAKENEIEQKKSDRNKSILVLTGITILIAISGIGIWYHSTAADRAYKKMQKSVEEYEKTSKELEDIQKQIDYNNFLIDLYEDD